eukprot:14413786-Alexandrium_andersonii.AAC.1
MPGSGRCGCGRPEEPPPSSGLSSGWHLRGPLQGVRQLADSGGHSYLWSVCDRRNSPLSAVGWSVAFGGPRSAPPLGRHC